MANQPITLSVDIQHHINYISRVRHANYTTGNSRQVTCLLLPMQIKNSTVNISVSLK